MEAQAAVTIMSSPTPIFINPKSTSSRTHFLKPIKVIMTPIATTAYRDSIDSDIDSYLKQVIKVRPPFEVFKPMDDLVFSTPKNIASALCIAACETVGGQRSDALSAAAALHLMHVAAAAHENLLVGNVRPEFKYSFGSNIKLLTGDGLVPLGFELLAKTEHNRNKSSVTDDEDYAGRIVRVLVEITQAIGSQGVINAQYRKYKPDESEQNGALCHVEEMSLRRNKAKRSDFSGCGAACGAILGGGSEEKIKMLRRCGMFLGMMNETLNDEVGNGRMIEENVMELRNLALKELEGLENAGGIEFISSVMDSMFGYENYKVWSSPLHSCVD